LPGSRNLLPPRDGAAGNEPGLRSHPTRRGRLGHAAKLRDLTRSYAILDRLEQGVGGARRLSSCDGRMDWPTRGVCFFFEPGEVRTDSGDGARVVRVGTHALTARSRTTLWNRLANHRGTVATGGGNHRGAIFRPPVGTALMRRDPSCAVDTWGQGNSAAGSVRDAECAVERRVSGVIGTMPLLWLRIDDPPDPASRRD